MRAFWWDGFWANIPETILVNYLGLYIIAFGASTSQVGLIASLSSLFAALAFFPGARFVERYGHRKRIVLASGGGLARIALFGLALVPFFCGRQHGGLDRHRAGVDPRLRRLLLDCPHGRRSMADIVPIGIRGRFFASRNFGMSLAALATAPIAGFILDRYSGLGGWQIVWLHRLRDGRGFDVVLRAHPRPGAARRRRAAKTQAADQRGVLADILSDRNFVMYLVGTAVMEHRHCRRPGRSSTSTSPRTSTHRR